MSGDAFIAAEILIVVIERMIDRMAHLESFKILFRIDLPHHLIDMRTQAAAIVIEPGIAIFDVEEPTRSKYSRNLRTCCGDSRIPVCPVI